jgi:hypothetical protein
MAGLFFFEVTYGQPVDMRVNVVSKLAQDRLSDIGGIIILDIVENAFNYEQHDKANGYHE